MAAFCWVKAMSNRYGLPEVELARIRERDRTCVYCSKEMSPPGEDVWRGDWATIEHLNRFPPWSDPTTVAICCGSCNSSRGAKPLPEWFRPPYCQERDIRLETVADPVREFLRVFGPGA